MVACSFENYGCDGGYLTNAVDTLMNDGTVTYECQPYRNHMNKCEYKCVDKSLEYKRYYCEPGTLRIMTTAD